MKSKFTIMLIQKKVKKSFNDLVNNKKCQYYDINLSRK